MSMSAIEVSTCKDVEIINIESGLDFILSHFKPPHFPRRISTFVTALTGEWQTIVNSREEAVRLCKESNNIDCRISAYPYPVPISKDGVNMQTTDFFLTDIDMKDFKTKKAFEQCLNKTLQNFNDKLHGAKPTILWTGGGYHALMPMNADIVLETERRIF